MVSTITRTAKPLPQHASTRTCTSSQPYVRTRTRTYHAGLHVAHGVEVEPLGAVGETLEQPVTLTSAVEHTQTGQVTPEVLRHSLLATFSATTTIQHSITLSE